MVLNRNQYIPCLRWKQGEYQALFRLSSEVKNLIVPLIEIAKIGFDFETGTLRKTLDEHLKDFAKRVRQKWGKNLCFVDIHLINKSTHMANGKHPLKYIFEQLRSNDIPAIPVTTINPGSNFQTALLEIVKKDNRGICLRIDIEELDNPQITSRINRIISACNISNNQCDLVLDIKAPNFKPIDNFVELLHSLIQNLPKLDSWRSFSIIGTAFPSTMAEVSKGASIVERDEWILYKQLVEYLEFSQIRIPNFGDYAINHPTVIEMDMRLLKPYASIRYTIDDGWLIIRGTNVRDNGFHQYIDLCTTVVKSTHYSGRKFSQGDEYIYNCAQGITTTGNLTTWRWVGTNHHLEIVARDCANFAVS